MPVVGEIEHDVLHHRDAFEDVAEPAEVVVFGDGEKPGTRLLTIEASEHGNPAPIAFEVVWENERGFPDGIESSARADSDGQNEHAEGSHAALSEQSAQAETKVLLEVVPP